MNANLTRIYFHLVCIIRRPGKWRFFAAGIGRELVLLAQPLMAARA